MDVNRFGLLGLSIAMDMEEQGFSEIAIIEVSKIVSKNIIGIMALSDVQVNKLLEEYENIQH